MYTVFYMINCLLAAYLINCLNRDVHQISIKNHKVGFTGCETGTGERNTVATRVFGLIIEPKSFVQS